ncbi:MAG: discoidin domain-containing protein [Verrucomicrobiia bacterium]
MKNNTITYSVIILVLAFNICINIYSEEKLPLGDIWRFSLDRDDVGVNQQWFNSQLKAKIKLPGSLPAQGIGDDISVDTKWTGSIVDRSWFTEPEYEKYRKPGNIKVPFWLQPNKYYVGVAWYQRDIDIPEAWRGKRVVLRLERPHWETRVWFDDKFIGSNNSLSTPHIYEFGKDVKPGRHRLTIRVDNRMIVNVGVNAHSVSDHTQGNWNGIVGDVCLEATDPIWLDNIIVYPDVKKRKILVKGQIGNLTGVSSRGLLQLLVYPYSQNGEKKISSEPIAEKNLDVRWDADGGIFQCEIQLGDNAQLWDEFNPSLYRLVAKIRGYDDSKTHTIFGLREIASDGTQFVINGRKTFIRGTLDCCIYPLTGHPPLDVESWKKVIKTAKAHGLNLIRFHSWCPPEAAFIAADELGFYFHVECAAWTTVGDGKPIDQWIYDEAKRIIKAYGNHPSFLFLLYGNEPGGKKQREYLAKWVSYFKNYDARRLYSSGAGWPQIPENQFHVTPDPRIQAWGAGLKSRINARPPETLTDYRDYISLRNVPVISHEIGQWCVYPNFDEIKKYRGYLKPKNFEIFRDTLNANHLGDLARTFLLASGKLQALCYKEDIESALRTYGMGGFELLDLHDFPGQGTALVGVLDPFWEPKGYITAKEYSRFCNSTVPLARLPKRVFTSDETLNAEIEIAHFGSKPITNAVVYWKLVNENGKDIVSGRFSLPQIPLDNGIKVGSIKVDLDPFKTPSKYRLVAGISGTSFENDWDIWVYPKRNSVSEIKNIAVFNELNDEALNILQNGGKVLLVIPPSRVAGDKHGKVALGFSSIFWNTAWTRGQPPHTLGILCDPSHPLFKEFPTEYHSNWQWWYIVTRAGAMILNNLPPELRPIIYVIDDWFTNRRLGLAFEARVLNGSLFVCSVDIENDAQSNPVVRQLRHCINSYMNSPSFKPKIKIDPEKIKALYTTGTAMDRLGITIIKATPFEEGYEPMNAFDGNLSTMWHSKWTDNPAGFPHELQIKFKQPIKLRSLIFTPRQDNNRNGWIKDIEIYTSSDGVNWGKPINRSTFPASADPKTITLSSPILTQFLRMVVLSSHSREPYASLAELEFITE